MIKYLNHELISSPLPNFPHDLVCIKCGSRLEPGINNNVKYYDFIINNSTKIIKYYNLTCEEQIIKNLLE